MSGRILARKFGTPTGWPVGYTDSFQGCAEPEFSFLCLHAGQPALMEDLNVEYQPPEI